MRGRLERRTWQFDPALYAPSRYRRACAYDVFVPDPIAGAGWALDGELAGVISDAESALGALNDRAKPAPAPLAHLLLRTESIASSRIEGLQVDLRDLARAESRLDAGGKAGPAAREILANIDAMELAVDEASSAEHVTIDQILRIHAALMAASSTPAIAGKLRTEQNWIGGNDYNPCGAAFVPPPAQELAPLLADLCAALSEEHLPPLMQAAIVHAQFETLHPFADGNGRTGRALVHVVLRRRRLTPSFVPPVSVILARDKDRYIQGLTAFRNGDAAGWVRAFAVATARAAILAQSYLGAVEQLQETWRERVRQGQPPRSDSAVWPLIDVLPAHPVITLPIATTALGRTKAAVNLALAALERAGVLHLTSSAARGRSWEAEGLLDLIAGLEAGDALAPRMPPARDDVVPEVLPAD